MGTIVTPPENIAQQLRAYGEESAASAIPNLNKEQLERISKIAYSHSLSGMLLAKAVSLAAIEVIEGTPRDLKRTRRANVRT